MSALVAFLVFCQALGAIAGTAMAVWGELSYLRAAHARRMDTAERSHLNALAHGLRYGMTLMLLASLGLVIVAYLIGSAIQPALTVSYWSFIVLALAVIVMTNALSKRRLSFTIGAALLYTAWWFLAYLTLGEVSTQSFGATVFLYAVAAGILYGVLLIARSALTPRHVRLEA